MFWGWVREGRFWLGEYWRMGGGLLMLCGVKGWLGVVRKLVNEGREEGGWCVVVFWLGSWVGGVERGCLEEGGWRGVEINGVGGMGEERRCLRVLMMISEGGIVWEYRGRKGD